MLYLHCGWPRTGTSSLQVALFENRDRLAQAGIVYPEKWLTKKKPTHHGVSELLDASRRSPSARAELTTFLADRADRAVLLSAEILTTWLFSREKGQYLLDLLSAAREVTPVRCIWTLRRIDQGLVSLYLRRLALGVRLAHPDEHFRDLQIPDDLFAGMCAVEAAVDGDVAYVRYGADGAHGARLLSIFDIPDPPASALRQALEQGPRRNESLSHKQAAALLSMEALAARAGVELRPEALRTAFAAGFRFPADRRCELIDGGLRRSVHERALAAARRQGFAPYADFFGGAEIDAGERPSLGEDALSDEDLDLLLAQPGVAPASLSGSR